MIAQRSGQIVNVSSTSGRKAYAFDTAYCASKYGIIGLTEALADEVRPYGVRVQAVLPGAIETPMWEQNGPLRRPHYALPPARVADVILYMLGLPEDAMLANTMIEPVGRPAQAGWRAAGAERP
jgi:NAD(P)-dependent dehydrogenase (short-subunit alcohol dehydrogenase family)